MDQWWKVICEWVNCLDFINVKVKSKHDFKDGHVYKRIIELIGVWKIDNSISEDTDCISSFIKEEYPEFLQADIVEDNDNIHTASLFLLRASQEPEFQKPMSTQLQHETQIKIKMFLETVLPYGRHVTADIIDMAINELMDETPTSTHKTPEKRPLREFFTSPAAVSAQKQRIVNERDRQIRNLRSELETERCEKAYLQDDLKSREEKIKNLQAKLQTKHDELKSLRDERMSASTPQSCKKSRDSMEVVYKREIDSLEEFISKLQRDCEKIESEKESLTQTISVLKIKLDSCEDKSSHFEKQSEMLLAQMELKDREIVDLRMQNEEFRNLIEELKAPAIEEQSFECDDVTYNKNRRSMNLNTSEVLSSVVEVQLLEVKTECDKLRAELETATKNLNSANADIRGLRFTNDILKEKIENIDQLADQLRNAESNLKVKSSEVSRLENEMLLLTEEFNHAKDQITNKDKALTEAERNEKTLKNELNKLTARLQILDESMRGESERTANLKSAMTELEQDKVILSERLKITEDNLNVKENSLRSLEESEKSLRNDVNKFVAKIQVLEETLKREETKGEELTETLSTTERENMVLVEKSRVLEKQLANAEESLKKAESQVLVLTREVQTANSSLSEEKSIKKGLNVRISKLEQENVSLLDNLNSSSWKIDNQALELKERAGRIEQLETEIGRLESQVQKFERSLTEEQHQNADYKSTISRLEQEKNEVVATLNEMESKLSEEVGHLTRSNEIVNQLQCQLTEIQSNHTLIEQQLVEERHLSEKLQLEIEKLQTDKAVLEDKLEDVERQLVATNDLLTQAKQNIEQRNKDNSNLENSLKKMEEFLAGERSEKAYLQTIIEKLESREQSLSENLNLVKTELNEKLQSLLVAMEDNNKLKTEIGNLETERQELEGNLKMEQMTINDLRNASAQLEKEHKKIRNENLQLKKDVGVLEKSVEKLDDELEKLKMERSDLVEQSKNEKGRGDELQKSVDALEEERKETLEKVTEYESTIRENQIKIESLEEKIASLNEKTTVTLAELGTTRGGIENLESAVSTLERTLTEKNKLIDGLVTKLSGFEGTINDASECLKGILSNGAQLLDGDFNFSTNDSLKDACGNLVTFVDALHKLVESKDETIQLKEERIKEDENELMRLRQEISRLEREIEEGKIQMTEISKEMETKVASLIASQEELQKVLEGTQNHVQNQKRDLEAQLSEVTDNASAKVSELEAERSKLHDDLSDLSQKLSDATAQIGELEKEKRHLSDQLAIRSNELLEANETRSKILETKTQLEEQLGQLSRTLFDASTTNKILDEQVKQLEAIKSEQESKLMSLQTELNQVLHDLKVSENTQEILKEQNNSQMSEVLTKLKNLKADNSKLTSNLADLTEESGYLKDQVSTYTEKCGSLSDQVKRLECQIGSLTSELEVKEQALRKSADEENRAKSRGEGLEDRLAEVQKSCEQLTINLKLKENSLDILQQKVESLGKEKLESELKLKEIIGNLEEARVQQEAALENQEKMLSERCLQTDQLQNNYLEIESVVKRQKEQNLVLEEKCNLLEDDLKSVKQSLNETEKNFGQCQTELKTTKDECNSLRCLNGKIESSYDRLHSTIVELRRFVLNSAPENQDGSLLEKIGASQESIGLLKTRYEELKDECEKLSRNVSLENESFKAKESENTKLREEVKQLEQNQKKYEETVSETLRKTEVFQVLLSLAMKLRQDFDAQMDNVRKNWRMMETKYGSVLNTSRQSCGALKELVAQKEALNGKIMELKQNHFENAHSLLQATHKTMLWTEKKLKNAICSEENADPLHDVSLNASFSSDETEVNTDIEKNRLALENIQLVQDKFEDFVKSVESFSAALKSGEIKLEPVLEEKLKTELEKTNREKKDLKEKLDGMRARNAKLEKNIDGLRAEIRSLKQGQSTKVETSELNELNDRLAELEKQLEETVEQKKKLQVEKEDLEKAKGSLEREKAELQRVREHLESEKEDIATNYKEELTKKNCELDERLKEVHSEYGKKLDVLKQKMKTAFNEQMTKVKQEQEKALEERVQSMRNKMEQQCRKHTEEINKYKNHVSELSTQYWDVGEKLIFEKQEKEQALQQLQHLKEKIGEKRNDQLVVSQKTLSLDRRDFPHDRESFRLRGANSIQIIEEETVSRRHSVRSIQAMGNPFNAEDEEGEIFDNNYLADLKDGRQRCLPAPDLDRLSVLQRRNTLCKPHLKSSYPAETQFQPAGFSEEEIKTGASDETFNDSLSQSLLPGQKPRKKDRTQGSELPRSPSTKILKERNSDKRTTVTPKRLKDFFSTSKKQDENGTPTGMRRLSIFRKQRPVADKI